jgi:hypothetical protein
MRRMLLPAFATCLLFAAGRVQAADEQAKSNAQIEQEVLRVEDEVNRAIEKSDTAVLDRLYGDEMVWMARGDVLNKAQVLAAFRSGKLAASNGKVIHDDIHTHIYGNTVVVTGRSIIEVTYEGEAFKGPRRFIQVYVNQNGQWRQVVHAVMENARK